MTLALTFLATTLAAVPAHPRLLADANDFAALKVRLAQSDLGRRGRERLLREADALLGSSPLEYKKDESGKRILHVSRAALNLIGKTAMACRLTDDRRYAARAVREALNVAAFPDWNPSHFLDTAEMTFAAAICYDWLYDAMTDAERETVYRAILKKGLTDGKGEIRSGWWTRGGNNWNQVCNGGLVAGAIATAERNPELTRRIVDRTVECLPYAMKVFAPDGGFPEGPTTYWPYALEYNTMAIWAIEKFDGTDHGLCSLPGFAAEVEYLDSCTGPTGAPFNFSDAGIHSLTVRGSNYPQWWLAKRFGRPDTLVFFERQAFLRSLARPIPDGHDFRSYNRFFPFLLLCLDDVPAGLAVKTPLRRVIGGENAIAVARTSWSDPDAWFVAMKGGRASTSHGHMDVGSFVLEANGVRWTHDLGNEVYSRIEASPIGERLWNHLQESPRWTLFRYSTRGHGTLQFDDEPQNVEGTAHFEPMKTGEGMSTRLNLSSVYGRDAFRTFTMGKAGGFTVGDEICAGHSAATVTWRVNTCAGVEVSANRALLTATNAQGRVCRMLLTATPADIVFAVVDRSKAEHDYELDNPGVKQLVFRRRLAASEATSFSVSFTVPAPDETFVASVPPAEAALRAKLPEMFAKAAAHYKVLDAAATPLRKDAEGGLRTPHGFDRATGKPDMRSIYWWTAGHFPGSLWYLYEATGDVFFRERAMEWTEILTPNAKVTDNHDVGFIMYCSYGNARRILKTTKYDGLLRETAESLCKRYNAQLGLIRSWGALDDRASFQVIPDNLMNLELLEWAAGESQKEKGKTKKCEGVDFGEIATSHADVTMKHHFRPDGGCYHVLDYDQKTKRVKGIMRGQGASCETAWSRGQSWAIYGYTMMYRTTRNVRYLDFARKLADYAINHPNMPADGVPYWDYGAPGEERDSSAGAIMASALLELSQYVGGEDRACYRALAVKQLLALSSSAYFSEGDEIGHFLLKHGTGHKPARSEVDTPLDYGDYYFLEALLRFRNLKERKY